MFYLSDFQLPELAEFTPVERRILLLNFSATHREKMLRRSRLAGYALFGGQIIGLITAVLLSGGSERSILPGMLGGLLLSFVIIYFAGLRLDRAQLRKFVASASRPVVPVDDRVAVMAYRGKPPRPNHAMERTADRPDA